MDPCSYTDSSVFLITEFDFDWSIDFEKRVISGTVALECDILADGARELTFDTKALDIKSVKLSSSADCKFSFGEPTKSKDLGQPLTIVLPDAKHTGEKVTLIFAYSTTAECTALQWLTPEQTCGGTHPYLFSQCWSVHARSLFPCQDSPGIKAKYRARISVPDPLVALMSANLQTEKTEDLGGTKVYYFVQHVPVSAYLVAIAAGALESRTIGPRSRVWSELEMVDAAAYEFSQTEDFIKTGEKMLGDYVWGQYDLLGKVGHFL